MIREVVASATIFQRQEIYQLFTAKRTWDVYSTTNR